MGSVANLTGDEKLAEDIESYINGYIDSHFPEGLTPALRAIQFEVCMDLFEAGAAWADTVSGRSDTPIILGV